MSTISVDLHLQLDAIDLCYWLDHAEEEFSIAPDVASWIRYWCPMRQFLELIEHDHERAEIPEAERDAFNRRVRENLERAFLDWIDSVRVAQDHKLACLGLGVKRIPTLLNELSGWMAQASIIEHNEYLFSRNEPHKYVKNNKIKTIKEWKPRREQGHYQIDLFDWAPLKQHYRAKDVSNTLSRVRRRVEQYRNQFPNEIVVRHPPVHRYLSPENDFDYSERRQHRKVVRRGIDLLVDFLGYEPTRQFVTGHEPLVIQGQHVAFRLKLNTVNQESSHGSMSTEVLIDDVPVCNLCIYTPDTPPLDHVASMIAHVRAGLEDDLLRTGNPFNIQVEQPTGVASLDEKLEPRIKRRRERVIVVRQVRPVLVEDPQSVGPDLDLWNDASHLRRSPDVIRLGESRLMQRLTRSRAHRIAGYFFQEELSDYKFPHFRLIEVR